MAILTKAQLEALNQASFPDQSTEAITPAILRTYNTATIDTLVDSLDTGSFVTDVSALNAFTASQLSINSGLNASSASQQISINALNSNSASANSSITQLNSATASLQSQLETIGTQSGSWGGGQVTSASFNAYTASTNADLTSIHATTASLQAQLATIGTQSGSWGAGTTGSVPAGTISGSAQITALGFVSSSVTASSLVTASFSGNTLTFTKGNGTTFGIVIPDVSGSVPTGTVSGSAQIVNLGFLQTSSFNTYTASQSTASIVTSISNLNTATASFSSSIGYLNSATASFSSSIYQLNLSSGSQQVSINALNSFTASQSTASIVTSITNLNTFSASVLVSISNLNTTTASLNSSITQLNASSASQQVSINALNAATSSYITSAQTSSMSVLSSSYAATASTATIVSDNGNNNHKVLFANAIGSGQNILADPNDFTYNPNQDLLIVGNISASANISASTLNVAGALTASLQTGYVWVGNGGNRTALVATSSFGGGSTINTGSFATTGSNTFNGNQNVLGAVKVIGDALSIQGNIAGSGSAYANAQVVVDTVTDPANIYSTFQGVDSFNNGLFAIGMNSYSSQEGGVPAFFIYGGGQNVTNTPILTAAPSNNNVQFWKDNNSFSGNVIISGSTTIQALTASLQQGYVWVGNGSGRTTTVATSSFTSFVSGTVPTGTVSSSAQILNYNIFATTGSNTFRGNQTVLADNIYGTNINIAQNAQLSGSRYNIMTQVVDVTTDPSNVYSGYQLTVDDEFQTNLASLAVSSYAEYPTPTGIIIGGGYTDGTNTVFGFPTAQGIDAWKTFTAKKGVNVTGSFNVSGSTVITGSFTTNGGATFGNNQAQYNNIELKTSNATYPGNLYNSIYINSDNNGPYSAGLGVSTYTEFGSDPVAFLFGGGNGNKIDGGNTALKLANGQIYLQKDTNLTGSLSVVGGQTINNASGTGLSVTSGTGNAINVETGSINTNGSIFFNNPPYYPGISNNKAQFAMTGVSEFQQTFRDTHQSGSSLVWTHDTGSAKSAVDLVARYNQVDGSIGVQNLNGSTSVIINVNDSVEIKGNVKLQRGTDKATGIISSTTDGMTVSNSLVSSTSIILLTPQGLDGSGNYVGASVYNVTGGSFRIKLTNPSANIVTGYMILNVAP